jgi:hypothetical protein
MNEVVEKDMIIDPLASEVDDPGDFFVQKFKVGDNIFVMFSKETHIPVKEISPVKSFSSKRYTDALSFEVYGEYAFIKHTLIRDAYQFSQILKS